MSSNYTIHGFSFSTYTPPEQSDFERLFEIFKELITHTSGDFDEAIDWMRVLDNEYKLTTPEYTIDDFIDELIKKRFIREGNGTEGDGKREMTPKLERTLRQHALEQIFGKLKRAGQGNHNTKYSGQGDEASGELMRSILHHPRFQELEASWRGAYLLVRKVETDVDLKMYLLYHHLPLRLAISIFDKRISK